MKCRHCLSELELLFVDLKCAPPSNAYLSKADLLNSEKSFPLRVLVCESCWLVQTEDFAGKEELFSEDYSYFSSFSSTWLAHAKQYVADVTTRFGLDSNSHLVEVASNDGYLLQYVKAMNIPCLGIEPTAGTAAAARAKGITVIEEFFDKNLAEKLVAEGKQADLVMAVNVLPHVPNINDFVAGFSVLLKPHGVATFEFSNLLKLISGSQFDTIYHEHFSYLSLTVVTRIFSANGLTVFDVEEFPTHGGSLRVYAQRTLTGQHTRSAKVDQILRIEKQVGIDNPNYYLGFQDKANKIRDDFRAFLLEAKHHGKKVAGYGAAAKGNTLMNYAGIRSDLVSFVADINPVKQNKYMPGSHIPIVPESHLEAVMPNYVIIFPWNLKEEVMQQLKYIEQWEGEFVTAVPDLSLA